MKIHIEATQKEFDAKREMLIKKLAGDEYEIFKAETVYDLEKPAIPPKKGYFTAQNQIMSYWDRKFKAMINNIKKDIRFVLES